MGQRTQLYYRIHFDYTRYTSQFLSDFTLLVKLFLHLGALYIYDLVSQIFLTYQPTPTMLIF